MVRSEVSLNSPLARATDSDFLQPAPDAYAAPELRLPDQRAFVGFPPLELAPGLSIADFALQIFDVTFLSSGASRYQYEVGRKCGARSP